MVAALTLATCGAWVAAAEEPLVPIVLPDGRTIQAELVTSMEDRITGLMHRPSLAGDRGMLFVFEQDDVLPITMQNMQFDLDIVFLGANRRILDLFEGVQHPDPSVDGGRARTVWGRGLYVLEVPSGTIQHYGLAVGDVLEFTLAGEEPGPSAP